MTNNSNSILLLFRGLKKIDIGIAIFFCLCCGLLNHTLFYIKDKSSSLKVLYLLLADLIAFFILIILIVLRGLRVYKMRYENSRLRARIILMFSLIAAIPTILISTFSVLIFSVGIEGWFDKEVSTAVTQSARVANIYIAQNKLQLRESLIAMATDISSVHFEVMSNDLLPQILMAHSEMRGITEAIIFDRYSRRILAQTSMSFGLSLWALPYEFFKKADKGEVADIDNDPGKLKMLIRLMDFPGETYLMISKLIDEETVNYISHTQGAATKYAHLMKKKAVFQVNLGLVFLVVSAAVIFATIIAGSYFGSKITHPIKKLVEAIEQVKAGNLTVQIEHNNPKKDELVILTDAFNKMIQKLDIQQKDLAIAHRSIAWNDVARRVAHEIKNPLTPISLCTERLAKKITAQIGEDQELQMYISIIRRHVKDIQKIITEFADFAKMPSPNFENANIVSIIKEIIKSRQILNENITYEFVSTEETIGFVCDTTQMHQLMINILKNAEEALSLSAIKQKIIITKIDLSKEELLIFIEDNGRGFVVSEIHKMTDAYITTNANGAGLGLAIVKKIVYDHGGELIISNGQNGGGLVKLVFGRDKLMSKVKR
ncbi:MAG: HAMP domain-containing protein [Alphaproteobacteria bacterium]|nr:HAMP domain-containing protein [Alphaproteobacteria bacterium]